jgi:hypothetical protein
MGSEGKDGSEVESAVEVGCLEIYVRYRRLAHLLLVLNRRSFDCLVHAEHRIRRERGKFTVEDEERSFVLKGDC